MISASPRPWLSLGPSPRCGSKDWNSLPAVAMDLPFKWWRTKVVAHDWNEGQAPSECKNPTEAGSESDDASQDFPHHGPSSSFIKTWWSDGRSIDTLTSLVDYHPPGPQPSLDYGNGSCVNNSPQPGRDVWLEKHVRLNPQGISNSFTVEALLKYPFDVDNADITFLMYLSRSFTREYIFDISRNRLIRKLRGQTRKFNSSSEINECFSNGTGSGAARIMTDDSLDLAVGVVSEPVVDGVMNFSQTERDYVKQYFKYRNLATIQNYKKVKAGTPLVLKTHIFVGSLENVKQKITKFCSQVNCNLTSDTVPQLSPKVFDVNYYLSEFVNPDLALNLSEQKGTGMNLKEKAMSHWLQYGVREGRRAHPEFSTSTLR